MRAHLPRLRRAGADTLLAGGCTGAFFVSPALQFIILSRYLPQDRVIRKRHTDSRVKSTKPTAKGVRMLLMLLKVQVQVQVLKFSIYGPEVFLITESISSMQFKET